jgi:predicted ATP-grasp superfamily ATP-dependent carboligase
MLSNILITSIGGGLGAELVNRIRLTTKFKNLKIIGTDIRDNTLSNFLLDKFYKIPKTNENGFLKNFLKIIELNKINLVIPGSDDEALKLCENRREFENEKCFLASIELDLLKKFSNKESTYKMLKKYNLPCADFYVAYDMKTLVNYIKKFKKKKEFVLKPSFSIGGRNVSVFRNDIKKKISYNNGKELHYPNSKKYHSLIKKNYNNKFPVIVSERLYSPVYDIDMLSNKGRLINVVVRQRLNPQVPNDGHILINSKKIEAIGKKIIKKFKLSWIYDCDCMTDSNGDIKIIEINPRMSGSLATSLIAGYPIIDNLLRIINNKKPIVKKINKRILVVPYKSLYAKNEIKFNQNLAFKK